jgi:hypothetical protein
MPKHANGATHTRARELTVEEKVRRIVQMFVDFTWRTGHSDLELAKEWGCSPANVRKYSAEARRWLCRDIKNPERYRGKLVANLEEIQRRALGGEYQYVAHDGNVCMISRPDYKAAIQASMGMGQLLNLVREVPEPVKREPAIIISKVEDEDEPPASPVSPPSDAGSQA